MKRNFGIFGKLCFIGFVILLLLIANLCISNKLNDRENAKDYAANQISRAAGSKFKLNKVYIDIPYTHTYKIRNTEGILIDCTEQGVKTFLATSINYDANLNTQMRTIGIYSAPIFSGELQIDCDFDVVIPKDEDGFDYFPEKAVARILVDEKSLVDQPVFWVNGEQKEVIFSLAQSEKNSGLSTTFQCKDGMNTLSTKLKIRGAESFKIMLSSMQSKLTIKSDWKSPGFTGFDYLPTTYDITDEGFSAIWNVPFSFADGKNYIGFDYVQTVDIYMMLHRAVDYGFLFIIVPFIVLFLFDVFMRTNFHPLHYLLSGAASVIFFLLLLSFSEHIDFTAAYIISALASGILVSLYVASVTSKPKLGCSMCGVFVLLYSYLYFSLKSEDYALLIGSLFIFILLAVVMFITRKVDWNNLGLLRKKNSGNESSLDLKASAKSDLIEK